MAETTEAYTRIAALRNVSALTQLIRRVEARGPGLPGMAAFYGPSGFGKTTAAIYAANKFSAVQVQVKSTWARKKFCEAILFDLGLKPARTIADMVDQIAQELARSGRPLLVDEADFLVQRGMIEVVRDIYESSFSTVILIGEELLPTSLQRWERVHGRMLDWVPAEPATLRDVDLLAPIYCPGVELAPELKAALLDVSRQSIRRICVNLDRALERARTLDRARLEAGDFDPASFFTGTAPAPRREVSAAGIRRVA